MGTFLYTRVSKGGITSWARSGLRAKNEKRCQNRYVKKISDKAITYVDEFKQLFIDEYMMGETPREIFEAPGFDVTVMGMY